MLTYILSFSSLVWVLYLLKVVRNFTEMVHMYSTLKNQQHMHAYTLCSFQPFVFCKGLWNHHLYIMNIHDICQSLPMWFCFHKKISLKQMPFNYPSPRIFIIALLASSPTRHNVLWFIMMISNYNFIVPLMKWNNELKE